MDKKKIEAWAGILLGIFFPLFIIVWFNGFKNNIPTTITLLLGITIGCMHLYMLWLPEGDKE